MKKLLLAAAVLAGAVSASRAGVNFNFGMDLPVPGPSIIVNHRMPVYAPDCERAPVCETRPTIVYNYPHRYTYNWHRGRPEWKRHNWGGNHRRNDTAPQYYGYYDSDRGYRNDRDCDRDYDRRHDGRRY